MLPGAVRDWRCASRDDASKSRIVRCRAGRARSATTKRGSVTNDQIVILVILAAAVGLFLWGRWRHDMVALAALLACVAAGLVPGDRAFAGFGHPAVITVACVLVLSSALQSSGAVDVVARAVLPRSAGPTLAILALAGLVALLSSVMNNVGAMALLMPVAIQTAARLKLAPGRVLMPVAFASLLGGMTTLIGTPPNLIVSGFRAHSGPGAFAMFDFAPVGLAVALAGLAFIALAWRLVPARQRGDVEGFETGAYLAEAHVPETSKAVGLTLREIEAAFGGADAQIVGLLRNQRRIPAPHPFREVRAGDILIIEAEPDALTEALSRLGLKLEEDVKDKGAKADAAGEAPGSGKREPSRKRRLQSDEVVLMELVVRPRAELVGRSASDILLRTRFGINLLALSREGSHSTARLRSTPLREGDVLLMQGSPEAIHDFANRYGCLPLAERPLRIPEPRKAVIASAVMACAIALAAFGVVPAAVAFAAGIVAVVVLGILPVRRVYDAIDWSVIVLLAALIPVAGAMSTTGTADTIARVLMETLAGGSPVIALALVLVTTMVLSDFMNNAATAAVMCPIAIGAAAQLGASSDGFLMAVAIGASCAFLTPIGHQNNTIILGPGGLRFGDYWRLGLPLEIVVVVVAVPMLLWIWPL
jgi:di/tricarboxylate transporter